MGGTGAYRARERTLLSQRCSLAVYRTTACARSPSLRHAQACKGPTSENIIFRCSNLSARAKEQSVMGPQRARSAAAVALGATASAALADVGIPTTAMTSHDHAASARMALGCVLASLALAAVVAGASTLAAAYFSIDDLKFRLLTRVAGGPDARAARARAARVAPLLKMHRLLFCSLMLVGSAARTALTLTLARVAPEWAAFLISIFLILACGEVLPQAICAGNPLRVAAACAPVARGLVCLTCAVSWPISALFDRIFGAYGCRYWLSTRSELKSIVDTCERRINNPPNGLSDPISLDTQSLQLRARTAVESATPFDSVYMVSIDMELTAQARAHIFASGHSRIPVYSGIRSNIVGILLTKRLVLARPSTAAAPVRVCDVVGSHQPIALPPDIKLSDTLRRFQQGRSHVALVCAEAKHTTALARALADRVNIPKDIKISGILTAGDALENLVHEDVVDQGVNRTLSFRGWLRSSAQGSALHNPRRLRKAVQRALASGAEERLRGRSSDDKSAGSAPAQVPAAFEKIIKRAREAGIGEVDALLGGRDVSPDPPPSITGKADDNIPLLSTREVKRG